MIYRITMGVLYVNKRTPNKHYTPEFKQKVVETELKEALSAAKKRKGNLRLPI